MEQEVHDGEKAVYAGVAAAGATRRGFGNAGALSGAALSNIGQLYRKKVTELSAALENPNIRAPAIEASLRPN